MTWHQHKKDVNYYNRLALANKIKQLVEAQFTINEPRAFTPPIPYSYTGGKKFITNIELYHYMSQFKRWFTTIRFQLDDGTYVPLSKLRTKHLTRIFQFLSK